MSLIIIILGALAVSKPYIERAFGGNWKKSGDSFGFGRRFNTNTVETAYYKSLPQTNSQEIFYDTNCYQGAVANCQPADYACEDTAKIKCKTDYFDRK